jgi:hypothetical protein
LRSFGFWGQCPDRTSFAVCAIALASAAECHGTGRTRTSDRSPSAYKSEAGNVAGASAYFIEIWDAVAGIGWQRFFPDWVYDRHFTSDVQYARHLQLIDEGRKGFKRVPRGGGGTVMWPDRQGEPEQFDQIWFAGNHADIGRSDPKNESRLSDITLDWMVEFITAKIPEAGSRDRRQERAAALSVSRWYDARRMYGRHGRDRTPLVESGPRRTGHRAVNRHRLRIDMGRFGDRFAGEARSSHEKSGCTRMPNSNDVDSNEMLRERVLSLLVVGASVFGGSAVQALPPILHRFP